jgi:hypothetical protein
MFSPLVATPAPIRRQKRAVATPSAINARPKAAPNRATMTLCGMTA